MDRPLAGLCVLDLSRYLPGPYLTRLLADLGADVVKLEPPGGDPMRYMPPLRGEIAAAYHALNAGKRSLCLDLKQPEDLLAAQRLVDQADVLVESYRPGVLQRLGLQLPASLICCHLSGYGQSGPLAMRGGHDINYMARAGLLDLCRDRHGDPVLPVLLAADVAGALVGCIPVLAALLGRGPQRRGAALDISLTAAAQSLLALARHRHPDDGLLTGGKPCYRIYATADGRHMALGALEPKFFANFCNAAGVPEWSLRGYDASLLPQMEALFLAKAQSEWLVLLQDADACCEPVLRIDEAAAPQRGTARPLDADRGAGF
jgi:crotonobetainyl-CoA:carnitine CoA-transferase CaiB-like acyl-CoA transferase